jgi:ribonuclease P protein component
LRRCHRLKDSRDFRRVFQRGKSAATSRFVLYWLNNPQTETFRVGISVSKKVGKAVVRNRVKRLVRECFQRFEPALGDCKVDFVVVCRPPSAEADFAEVCQDLSKLLRRGKFMV